MEILDSLSDENAPRRRILVAPLNWGLGHATRCIPLIERFLHAQHEVFLAGDGDSLQLLKNHFPQLSAFELPAYHIRYGKNGSILPILRQLPRLLLKTIPQERRVLRNLVREHSIDLVISDNRYGCWTKDVPNVFICHQIALLPPKGLGLIRLPLFRLHLRLMRMFQEVWIPDFNGKWKMENGKLNNPNPKIPKSQNPKIPIAGTLSHYKPLPLKFKYIGVLSRFMNVEMPNSYTVAVLNELSLDVLVVLSGPEPQRTILEEKIKLQAQKIDRVFWIVQGKPTENAPTITQIAPNVWQLSHLETPDLLRALNLAKRIISRSGYSSLMDYTVLGLQNLILIPTPAQTEQEYLAAQWAIEQKAIHVKQDDLSLADGLES